ncbi:AGC family protein kinase [Trichomonas vaginalis G3]|uniref:non-specific serine/threonine protein kinase n=1 Tax=Trichomonas vaginalis (strain ATCC PRA-98 / G3) TaxID=412133 RepID=A2F460_TRIV3|nr:3-phosphoinositide-dependent protein kinase protein [Trichomonas vaginalis G3]EAY00307.1 AGC family protein kinase [Trichomonas vaginalis G3]KAI5490880.1 3-phosphoinositide-dependent protein kinase protein [Trichomonas vaginalis G3]|eukprot:XP_001313236.1 AGC family protein kinase [Trichomonas vaginalis G3]
MELNFRFEDFIVESPIGQGAFGQIYKAIEIKSGKTFALKALNRRFLIKMKKQSLATQEKDALTKAASPFVVKLYGTFKDASNLYFVLDYAEHGDLAEAVNDLGSLNTKATTYVCAQLLEAISTLHAKNIIHRDIKIENILLNYKNYIMLTDFGTAMMTDNDDSGFRPSSVVGTPDFVAPELLNDGHICYGSDMWAFGCVIFNLLTGKAPFEGNSTPELMSNIVARKICSDIEKLPKASQNIITSLLEIDPKKRLGYNENSKGYPSIRNHPFFKNIPWDKLETTEMPLFGPFKPETATSFAEDMLAPGETIMLEGVVERKRGLMWKGRLLIITNQKKLLIFNIENKTLKSTIQINAKVKVQVAKDGKEWTLNYGDKSQLFRCKNGDAGLWASTIIKSLTTR